MGSCMSGMTDEERAELTRLRFAGELTPERIAARAGVGDAARVERLEREVERQKRHNALLTGTLRQERERRKQVQAACDELRRQLDEAKRQFAAAQASLALVLENARGVGRA